jgi:hypothetical protein
MISRLRTHVPAAKSVDLGFPGEKRHDIDGLGAQLLYLTWLPYTTISNSTEGRQHGYRRVPLLVERDGESGIVR